MSAFVMILVAVAIGSSSAWAASKKDQEAISAPATDGGKKLEAEYAGQLEALRTEIADALPVVDEQKKADFLNARAAEVAAKNQVEAAQKRMGEINTAKALVGHAKGKWIGGAAKDVRLETLLSNDKFDANLAKYVFLLEGTPRGLAAFAEAGEADEALIGKLTIKDFTLTPAYGEVSLVPVSR